jgi:3-hydroxyisobutyrate dehydrogenase-like beta-hydroxyacid dehydrogenase
MKISVVGMGIMGSAMAGKLIAAGHEVTVTNRSPEKAGPLLASGAKWADTPAEAAASADVAITMVTDPAAVEAVSLGAAGILEGLGTHAVHAEMSTVSPSSAAAIAARYGERGARFVQAPVLGSRAQIEQGTLLVLAGGDASDIALCSEAWSAFAKRVWTLGEPEQASAFKLGCNMLIAQMILALGQSITFVRKHGIPAAEFLDVIDESALASPMFRSKGGALLKGNFTPNFVVRNLLKDVGLAADAAHEKGCTLPFNALAAELLTLAVTQGYGDEDYSAVVKTMARQAEVDIA